MCAHLLLAGRSGDVGRVLERYAAAAPIDRVLTGRFAGVEMMRRLIGVAQLPLEASIERKRAWLAASRRMVCEPDPWEAL